MIREDDFHWPERFWEEKGEAVKAAAKYVGLPCCEMAEGKIGGLSFCQVLYLSQKKKKRKMKWLINEQLKKKQEMLNCCIWTVFPVGIAPLKRSFSPKDQCYGYLVQLRTCEDRPPYSARIEVRWDGSITKQDMGLGKEDVKDIREQIPTGFRYPKAILAKLNRCLARFFWSDLWCGPACAAWYRPEEGMACYMGAEGRGKEAWWEGLRELLQSPYGDAVAVLIAYTCFSLLRPWFQSYPALNEKSAYLVVKRKLTQLLALNVCSKDIHSAEQLAELCCGAFQHMGDGKNPVIDGIAIQRAPERSPALNENEFERKILQSACALWVNRQPAKGIGKENKILSLQVPPGFDLKGFTLEPTGLISALVKRISDEDFKQYANVLIEDRKGQTPIALEAIEGLRTLEKKYEFVFQDVDIEEEIQELQAESDAGDVIEQIADLRRKVHLEITTEAKWNMEKLDNEAKELLSGCLRDMRKVHKENCVTENFLKSYHKNARLELGKIDGALPSTIEKVTFLWASAKFFIMTLPESERLWVRQKMFQALRSFVEQQKEPWSAGSYLGKYIAEEIKNGHCVRIRGKGSDDERVSVWYDPKGQLLLLPAGTYFDQMKPYIKEPHVTKRVFEQRLADAGVIITVKRGKQLRRTYEVRVQIGKPSIAVLKVGRKSLWESGEDEIIWMKLQKLSQDQTPFRTH